MEVTVTRRREDVGHGHHLPRSTMHKKRNEPDWRYESPTTISDTEVPGVFGREEDRFIEVKEVGNEYLPPQLSKRVRPT